jgi:GNAT superfamily N-acetyltransferase
MEVAAREATTDDAPEVAALARCLRSDLAGERGASVWVLEARAEPLEESLFDEARVVVGTIDGVPVGYAVAHLRSEPDGSWLAVVEEIYVQPEAREVGVGEGMIEDMIEWARARGCRGIDGVVLPGLREGKNLFERVGMPARAITTHREL